LGLLRILELASNSDTKGSISLDDLNIENIGLHELRQKVTIIPQDPVLFTGTVRTNIDPFEIYQRDDIVEVLKKVRLWDFIGEQLVKQ
jgi:ABC-type multidrug transport system fused ATPase/permease subunit